MQTWYQMTNAAQASDVRIYDVIGMWGVTSEQFVSDLAKITSPVINLHLNTPGGQIMAATAIHNALKDHPAKVVVHIDGMAASAGAFIAMAGDEIRIAPNGYMMIHNAQGEGMGYADDLRKQADLLDKMTGNIAEMYAKRTGKPKAEWLAAMADETWYTAQEAVDAKLADSIKGEIAEPSNRFDLRCFNKAPTPVLVAWGNTNGTSAGAPARKGDEQMETLEAFNAYAAKNPDAVKPFIEQGYNKAKLELAAKPATAAELKNAFAGESDFILLQLETNATLEAARGAFADVLKMRLASANAAAEQAKADAAKHVRNPVPGGTNQIESNAVNPLIADAERRAVTAGLVSR
jgi:ATP-dependent protease ClpP protease subunit